MKNRKKRNKILLLLVLLLAISVGFAALATTLKINGTAGVGKNTWNIYWDNIANESGATPEDGYPDIGPDENNVPKTLVTWEVTLDEPGDFYEFTVDAVNAGTLDAEILEVVSKYGNSVIPDVIDAEHPSPVPSYIKYSVVYADNNQKPSVGDRLNKATVSGNTSTPTRRTYKVRVEYDREAVTNTIVNNMNENGESHTFSLSVKYGQATPAPTPSGPEIEITRQTPGQITPGDKVCIAQTECFHVISTDGTTTKILAKYNLLVGNTLENGSVTGTVPVSTEGYGLQSSQAFVYNGEYGSVGSVPFATTDYWYNHSTYELYPEYGGGNNYPAHVYNSNSAVAQYVNLYVSKLITDFNMPDTITGSLLTYAEASAAENLKDENNNYIIANRATSYWLGDAYTSNSIYVYSMYQSSSMIDRLGYNNDSTCGVRPIISIPTSLLSE